ncbi:serine/threonine-protein kinase ATG1c-like isoform X2 [Camellia sinensis]|uniref:serine/threonine-protein kinase ATG1c-like isoform X2 n=1 Tax=Camellia sinensis TaxID=4442 RepID=UPI001036A99B|nr:serine/threonine-protein kinase ATG1c-like isoform X2 [Camellia sinensis]
MDKLQWGNRKRLRCVKVKDSVLDKSDDGGAGGGAAAAALRKKTTSRVDRRVVVGADNKQPYLPPPPLQSPHRLARSMLNENRKISTSSSPEKEDRYYTTRGSIIGLDDSSSKLFMEARREDNHNKGVGGGGGGGGGRYVGDYVVGRQIGSGSFSVVWHARHKVHGTEVAIKEIHMGRLNKKLQESLMSEIVILRQTNHPNIIRLHDIIEETGRIHLVLEYCRGGDLSIYIQQRQGRVPEATAKYFMQQLAAGLQILRDNNIIHRDLKPQNLLLSTNTDNAVLKIADFGFARSLQPRGLAETLCGSPLYMAPEIMQLQKYDPKADLWSVGAILFQLVTGKTPFTGNNQIQLLQNIMKSTELQFPPNKKDLSSDCLDLCQKLLRRNPVERLTFEEFFNHPFLSLRQSDEFLRNSSPRTIDGFSLSESNPVRNAEESSQDDCLPFILDDDSSGPDGSPSFVRRPSMKSTYGFSLDTKVDRKEVFNTSNNMDRTSKNSIVTHTGFRIGSRRSSDGNLKESFKSTDQRPMNTHPRVVDSLELVYQDYVIVSGPPMDVSSSLVSASKPSHLPRKLENPQEESANFNTTPSAPMPIIGAVGSRLGRVGSLDSHSSTPSGTSHGSMDIGDALEQPSLHCMTRIKSLQWAASAITELVNKKIEPGRQLEAFSIQLVILAIWKQALHICHTQAASAIEGSPSREMARLRESTIQEHGSPDIANTQGPQDICSQIEREFLLEVGNAEELAKVIAPGNTEMPDAMETIYQSALALGRRGAVDEYMGDTENAAVYYSKAVRLLVFLLVEAPSLILNPPFCLTESDRYRLRNYIDALNNRQSHSRSQRMALLKSDGQQCPP